MRRTFSLALVLLLVTFGLQGQSVITGTVNDSEGDPIPGAAIKAMKLDSALVLGVTTDLSGSFTLHLPPSRYILAISALSYKTQYRTVTLDGNLDLGILNLRDDAQLLKEVEVKTTQTRGEQRGDTTSFNAGAFKTNPDASAEDLVKKMPGVSSDNTGLKVNGENVQRVLVDGKPFFGDDPAAALKNLPAEIIDKVEVFDKMSDQAQFTGFDDGSQQKTINLVTKKDRKKGVFGRVYGGIGTDEDLQSRYNAGAAINSFSGERRVSLLLLSNNVNQQNFSSADIADATGGSDARRGPGRGRSRNQAFTSPSQNGITETQAAGINYSEDFGKHTELSGSYFFNFSDNRNASVLERNYFTNDQLRYNEESTSRNSNLSHRVNLRIEHKIDSMNKIIYRPAITFQTATASSNLDAMNSAFDAVMLSRTSTKASSHSPGFNLNHSLTYQHRFAKKGRTISLDAGHQQNERSTDGSYRSISEFSDSTINQLDQHYDTYGYSKRYSANLSYTEPLGKYAQVQISYLPSLAQAYSNKETNDFNVINDRYDEFNPSLSNKSASDYQVQRGGVSYRLHKEKLNFNVGVDAQQAALSGQQEFPSPFTIRQDFENILPSARINYKFSKTRNLRVNYRTSTNIPDMNQLQNVVDISNPLQVRTGNPALRQTFENSLFVRYGGFNPETSRNIMVYLNAGQTSDFITNATRVLKSDTVIQGFTIKEGAQFTRPVNLDGNVSSRLFFVYGFPLTSLKSNLNFNASANYNRNPALMNNVLNYSNSYATSGGLFAGSNISESLDFSIGYNAGYTMVKNSAQPEADNAFFTQSANVSVNWIFLKRLVINSDVRFSSYTGLNQGFNQDFTLWNAAIGYKMLANRALELRVSAFDLLNQNRSVGRNVEALYTEDYNTVALRRYFLVTLSYTLRKFGGAEQNTGEASDGPSKKNKR